LSGILLPYFPKNLDGSYQSRETASNTLPIFNVVEELLAIVALLLIGY
jgi:hypothetical protein